MTTSQDLSLRSIGWRAAAIVFLVLAAYFPTLKAGYIWDDKQVFLDNPQIQSPSGWRTNWYTPRTMEYLPVTFDSFWIEWRLWGDSPSGYHATNMLLHIANCLLIWRLLAMLEVPGAWLGAVLFALHPVNVASVAWIAERKNVLSTFFALCSLLAFLRFDASGKRRLYGLSLFLFVVGLLSKTSIVMLPLVLPLIAYYKHGTVRRRDWLRASPFLALALIAGMITIYFQSHFAIRGEVVRPEGVASRIAAAGWATWFYLSKACWPTGLCMPYPRWNVDGGSLVAFLPLAGVVAVLGGLWVFRKSLGRGAVLGIGFYLLNLLPVLGLTNMSFHRFSLVADHWQHLSLIGLMALIGAVSVRGYQRFSQLGQRTAMACLVATIALLSCLTWRQASVYESMESWCRDTLMKNPTAWVAHNNLGIVLQDRNELAPALDEFQSALKAQPDRVEIHMNAGLVLAQMHRLREAAEEYAAAIRCDPGSVTARYDLATTHLMLGEVAIASEEYEQVLAISPNHAPTQNKLGGIAFMQNRHGESLVHFRIAATQEPTNADFRFNLATSLVNNGQEDDAILELNACLSIDQRYEGARVLLGQLLLRRGRNDEAIVQFRNVLSVNPNNDIARSCLEIAKTSHF
jgi:tetratricopeptide (TPR) repeat protein